MTSFSFFKYFDAFELDVNIVNFVYYGKTRLKIVHMLEGKMANLSFCNSRSRLDCLHMRDLMYIGL